MALKVIKDTKHKLNKKKFVSIRFLAALILGFVNKEKSVLYQFTKETKLPDLSVCTCAVNKLVFEPKEYPPFALGYWERLISLVPDKEEATKIFRDFIKRLKVYIDSLHANKSNNSTVWEVMSEIGVLDIEKFKASEHMGGKKKKSPNQCSGGKIRNIACGYKETIMTCLKPNITNEEKENFEKLLELNAELQFFAYANYTTLCDKKLRLQCWLVAFEQREQLKKCFKDNVRNALNMHTHGMNSHLCEHVEEAVKQGFSLIELSMEHVESQFPKLNKINSNRHEKDLANNFLITGRIDIINNNDFQRKRSGSTNNKFIEKWVKEHKWKQKYFVLGEEEKALLIKLEKYGYKENVDWKICGSYSEKIVVFEVPN